MKFEIIKNSEGCKKWNIPDNEYKGQIPGLSCGWEFEVKMSDGTLDSLSVIYEEATPEETVELNYLDRSAEFHGYSLTGRVVFRGYGRNYYDTDYRDWCVITLTDEEVDEIINEYK